MNKEKQYIDKQALIKYIEWRNTSGDGSEELYRLQMNIEAGMFDSAELEQMREEVERLKAHLQDALNTLNWYVDSSMAEYVDDAGVKAAETLERIQEGNGNE